MTCKAGTIQQSAIPSTCAGKRGVALIVVMWVLVITSLIVMSFSFEAHLEAKVITMQRKRFQADQLALAGMEVAKAMLDFQEDPMEGDDIFYEDPMLEQASRIAEGIPVYYEEQLGNGTFRIKIDYEKGKRNIHKMNNDEWYELFLQTGVPVSDHDKLIDCLKDWEDEDDLTSLNGAEKDDSFYEDRDYEPKNAPIDTIDELLLIKGWTEEVLYGTPPEKQEETENPMTGVAKHLTTWGTDGKINPNSASEEVLSSMYLDEFLIEDIMKWRLGPDEELGTEDDGILSEDFDALGLDQGRFTLTPEYVTIKSEGEVGGVISQISAIYKIGNEDPRPLLWLEGPKEEDK